MVQKLSYLSLKCRISRMQIKQIFTVISAGNSNLKVGYDATLHEVHYLHPRVQELCLQHTLPACLSHEKRTELEPELISSCLSKLVSISISLLYRARKS